MHIHDLVRMLNSDLELGIVFLDNVDYASCEI